MAKVFPTIVGDDGLTYYQIQKGQILYRGDTGIYLSRGEMPNVPAFFGILKKRVAPYGMVFTFETKKPLKLLALDLHEENRLLLDPTFTTDSKIRKILLEQYGFQSGLRDTVHEKDHKLLKYLCSLGMDGYYINEMDVPGDVPIDPFEDDGKNDTDPSKFHSEIGLCNVNQNVELVNYQADVLNYTSEQREAARLKKIAMDKKYEDAALRAEAKKRGRQEKRRLEQFGDPYGLSSDGSTLSYSDSGAESSDVESTSSRSSSKGQSLFGSASADESDPFQSISSPGSSSSPGSPLRSSQQRSRSTSNRFSSPFGLNSRFGGITEEEQDEFDAQGRERTIPRIMSNLEDRLAQEEKERSESRGVRTSTPKRGESPFFDFLDAEAIDSPLPRQKKKRVTQKDDKNGGKKKKKTKKKSNSMKKKKTRKNKTPKKKRHTFKKRNKRKIKQTRK